MNIDEIVSDLIEKKINDYVNSVMSHMTDREYGYFQKKMEEIIAVKLAEKFQSQKEKIKKDIEAFVDTCEVEFKISGYGEPTVRLINPNVKEQ